MARSRRIASCVLVLTVAASMWLPLDANAAKPGEAGLLFLRLGLGAREIGMGGAGVASATGGAAAYWNPANLTFTPFNTELILQHKRWLGAFDVESAALTHQTKAGVIGVLFSGMYSDPIERYSDDNVGIPEGSFEPYDVAFGLSFARKLHDAFAVGVMAKFVYERIDVYSDSGFAFDFFVTHKAVIEGLTFGASASNIGPQMNLHNEPFDLPTIMRAGMAYVPPMSLLAGKLTMAGDVVFPNDGNEKAHAGLEIKLIPEFALRVGSRINYDSQGLTAGAGFRMGSLEVGYAYEELINELDHGHLFTVEMHY